jgi:3-isopropylmalate/(R)-2-methylmalate dehydratase large subunit
LLRIVFGGQCPDGMAAKDLVLAAIGQIGVDGGVGYAVEYAGPAIEALSMEGRRTGCNMSIEAGARAGLKPRTTSPSRTSKDAPQLRVAQPRRRRLIAWQALRSDDRARFDREVEMTSPRSGLK